jgi:hypothetical protein
MGAFYGGIEELPLRPLDLISQPAQLKFSAPNEKKSMEVVVSLPASAKRPVQFHVFQNKVFNWFTVSPSSGEIRLGESVKLKVAINNNLLVGRPLFRGAFLVRTEEGLSRPVTVYANGFFKENFRPQEAGNSVYINPTSLPGMKEWVSNTTDASAAGQRYLTLNAALKSGEVNADVTISKTGKYFLLARINVEKKLYERNFSYTIGDRHKELALNPRYHWTRPDKSFKVIFLDAVGELKKGKYKLRFGSKDDMNLNELIITDDPAVFFIQQAHKG